MGSGLIGVTGATGRIGGMVAGQLARAGRPQRLLVRRPSAAPHLEGAEVARCDYQDPAAAAEALRGVDVLFMVSAHEGPQRVQQHKAMVEAARDAGVAHVVYTSYVNPAPDAEFTLARDHWATEQALRDSGMAHTFLRDNMYLDFAPELVGADGVIRGPAGGGRAAMVARADVAEVAARVLLRPQSHAGAAYDMTGPEALDLRQVAALLGRARGCQVRYEHQSTAQAWATRSGPGVADWQVAAWVSTYTAMAAGDLADVSGDVERLTGRAPTSFAQFLGLVPDNT